MGLFFKYSVCNECSCMYQYDVVSNEYRCMHAKEASHDDDRQNTSRIVGEKGRIMFDGKLNTVSVTH